MSSKAKQTVGTLHDPSRQAQDATRALTMALQQIHEQGDLARLKRAYRTLEKELGLQVDVFAPTLAKVEQDLKSARERLGTELRRLAREANCDFKYEPPHITFGCVTLREKSFGTWELSMLDDVVLETIHTTSASRLADRSIAHIEEVEVALTKTDAFLEAIQLAYDLARLSAPESTRFSPNLLMLLASFGKSLTKQLVSRDKLEARPLSRVQFGFLLEQVRRLRHESDALGVPALRFEGAVVQITGEPHRYLAIPSGTDPRRALPSRLVASIALTNEH
jgi:hypothetical protein